MTANRRAPAAVEGRFSYPGLDRVIHEKARLGIMTSLVAQPAGLSFTDLKELCGLTDGNLNRHLEVLREAGLVVIHKEQGGRRLRTVCRVTKRGQGHFLEYLAELERVVAAAAQAAQAAKDGTQSVLRRLSPA
jgi:DNA-binding transcriptional ArsR family regulator